jgi:excisionase family DNA binding protein
MGNSNFMDVGLVSEYLHVAKSTVYNWTSQGLIPYVKLAGGKKTLYIKEEIDNWVLSHRKMSVELPELPNY